MTLTADVAFGTRFPWAPSTRRIAEWVAAASPRHESGRVVAVRVVTAFESRRLNREYRGKDRPTNVLSFPSGTEGLPVGASPVPLGDLAICARVVAREAREQGKSLAAHWAHMVVHGTLHLLGYDHEVDADARRMERREILLLKELGFANPYREVAGG